MGFLYPTGGCAFGARRSFWPVIQRQWSFPPTPSPSGITDWEAVKDAALPVEVPNAKRYVPGSYLEKIDTPTGKIELYSERTAKYTHLGLSGLPEYVPAANPTEYPFTLIFGARFRRVCPVQAPVVDRDGKAPKCDGCRQRVKAGLLPACVKVCPMKALELIKE